MQLNLKVLPTIRQVVKHGKILANSFSTSECRRNLVQLDVDDKTRYATLTLNRPPVNSLNLELLQSISEALDKTAESKCRGLILTSSSDKVFSAGLDIMEMYKPNVDRAKQFWSTLQEVWMKLYGFAIPTTACINGHSPAGGCLLSLCTEYRVMCQNFTIGLNETRLGIVAPTWFQSSMSNVLSRRQTEMALTLGTMFTSDEALKVGLVDELAVSKEDAMQKCIKFLDQFKKISLEARGITKQAFRAPHIRELEDNREQDVDLFIFAITQKKVQQGLEAYLESLKTKKP